MPVTSVEIDADLLAQAKKIFGVRTTKEAIFLALRDVVLRHRQLAAIEIIASTNLDPDGWTVSRGD